MSPRRQYPPPLPRRRGRKWTYSEASLLLLALLRTLWRLSYVDLLVLLVRRAIGAGLTRLRDVIIDSAPARAWRRHDLDAQVGHAPAQHPTRFLRGFRAT